MRRITRGRFTRTCRVVCGLAAMSSANAQTVTVPLSADQWTATDSVREETYLGRPSLYINRGVAIARDVAIENGTIEYDVAATPATNFLGVAFHAASPRFSEVVMFRVRQSGTLEALQYAPAFNNTGAAWQVYHGPESNAVVTIPRERWVHVSIELDGATARIFFDTATMPTLIVPQLAGAGGRGSACGRAPSGAARTSRTFVTQCHTRPLPRSPRRCRSPGTSRSGNYPTSWIRRHSRRAKLPDPKTLTWERITAEAAGFVLVNRYRVGRMSPGASGSKNARDADSTA